MITQETKKLIAMKERLEEVSIELARLDGKHDDLLKRLKDKSGHNDVKKASTVLAKLQKKLEADETAFSKGVTTLEEDYEW